MVNKKVLVTMPAAFSKDSERKFAEGTAQCRLHQIAQKPNYFIEKYFENGVKIKVRVRGLWGQ